MEEKVIKSIFDLDAAVIKKLQEKLGVKADGMIGNGTVTVLQKFLNDNVSGADLTADGQIGPKTIKALQTWVGVSADGAFGSATAKALIETLGCKYINVKSIFDLDVETIKQLQEKLDVKADGMIGAKTVTALQNFLNDNVSGADLKADGQIGPKTIKALQKWVGVEADGAFGPDTAEALVATLEGSNINADGTKNITTASQLDDVVAEYMRQNGIK